MRIKRPCDPNQAVSKVAIDTPIAALVGIGERRPFDRTTEAGVIKLAPLGGETNFDVAQALAMRQLRESHGEKLIPTREGAHTLVATIARDATIEFFVRNKLDELSKYRAALIHWSSPSRVVAKE
jgi:cobyrinic acid a,c-diamide synthase